MPAAHSLFLLPEPRHQGGDARPHAMFAGCAAAISIGNSKHANATHAARTITRMTMPSECLGS
jgi:hypothetical protein